MDMDYSEYDVMSRYHLLSASEDFKKWSGFIRTEPRAILISLAVPQFPTCKDLHLESKDLDVKTVKYWNLIFEQISIADCATFLDFLVMLEKRLLEDAEDNGTSEVLGSTASVSSDFYSAVIDQVEKIGSSNVVSLSADFKTLVIKARDRSEREHQLKLTISMKYPDMQPKVVSELPFPPESLQWPGLIQGIYNMFLALVDKCCKFWDDMDELDFRVKVIEPLQPERSHYHRRILLEDNVIVHIVFNPVAPRAFPTITFSGPEDIVNNFRAAIDSECKTWDETMKVTQNLQSILDCEFVKKESQDGDDENEPFPCTVCFVYNFNDEIPEINCDCGAVYHKQCLQDLLVSDVGAVGKQCLRKGRTVECPSCQLEIKIPQRLAATSW